MSKPFIKWAGGKTQLLKELRENVPESFGMYYEPFLGGGALFFDLQIENSVLNDCNGELINAFQMVRDRIDDLIDILKTYINDKNLFMKIRSLDHNSLGKLSRAARFIFLNKTCFNGLYRVNSKNEFNVSFGDYKNPKICDEETLRDCSRVLSGRNAILYSTYFENVLGMCGKNDFVYMDPPYFPVSETSFVKYSKKGFGKKDHEKVYEVFEELDKKGVRVMLSNSATDWVKEKYRHFNIIEVQGKRSINSDGKGRGKVSELLIKNY